MGERADTDLKGVPPSPPPPPFVSFYPSRVCQKYREYRLEFFLQWGREVDTFFTAELRDNIRCQELSKSEAPEGSRGGEVSLYGDASGLVVFNERINFLRKEVKVERLFGRIRELN